MKYALVFIAYFFATSVNAETWCQGETRIFFDGKQMTVDSSECQIRPIEREESEGTKFQCPSLGYYGDLFVRDPAVGPPGEGYGAVASNWDVKELLIFDGKTEVSFKPCE